MIYSMSTTFKCETLHNPYLFDMEKYIVNSQCEFDERRWKAVFEYWSSSANCNAKGKK